MRLISICRKYCTSSVVLVTTALVLLLGCNLSSELETNQVENGDLVDVEGDVDVISPDVATDAGHDAQPGDDVSDEDVSPNQNQVQPDPPGTSLFSFCGAGGVSSDGNHRLTHCTGPFEAGGTVAEGDGYRWEPGLFEAIAAD